VAGEARLGWLDLYRGLAVLVMIETHVSNTFLAAVIRESAGFARWNYVNGLVAPAFLFIAGYAHGLGMRRAQTRRGGAGRRLRRLAGIALAGFALHVPWKEIAAGRWDDALRLGTAVNILPCLAAAIGVLVIVERFAGSWTKAVVALLTAAVLILAEPVGSWTGAPVPLLAWVNQTTGSLFPLLPWGAFAWVGFLLSARPPDLRALALAALGSAMAVFALGRADFSPASAVFFFERLVWILALLPLCVLASSRCAPRVVIFAGQESLVMYVAHLVVITTFSLLGLASLGAVGTAATFAVVLAMTFAAAWAWRRFELRIRGSRASHGIR
jgi:uncharacterized membrane protein